MRNKKIKFIDVFFLYYLLDKLDAQPSCNAKSKRRAQHEPYRRTDSSYRAAKKISSNKSCNLTWDRGKDNLQGLNKDKYNLCIWSKGSNKYLQSNRIEKKSVIAYYVPPGAFLIYIKQQKNKNKN